MKTIPTQCRVSAPFMVWAMRRTGSTALMRLLREVCGRQSLEGEPFFRLNSLGPTGEQLVKTSDFDTFRQRLEDRLQARPMLKHCYDYLELPVHYALLNVTHLLGYRHVILHRRDEFARALSLELARQTGHWGETETTGIYDEIRAHKRQLNAASLSSLRQHIQESHQRREWLLQQMSELRVIYHSVFFEDIYQSECGLETVHELLKFIQLDLRDDHAVAERLATLRESGGQHSQEIALFLPNYHEIACLETVRITP